MEPKMGYTPTTQDTYTKSNDFVQTLPVSGKTNTMVTKIVNQKLLSGSTCRQLLAKSPVNKQLLPSSVHQAQLPSFVYQQPLSSSVYQQSLPSPVYQQPLQSSVLEQENKENFGNQTYSGMEQNAEFQETYMDHVKNPALYNSSSNVQSVFPSDNMINVDANFVNQQPSLPSSATGQQKDTKKFERETRPNSDNALACGGIRSGDTTTLTEPVQSHGNIYTCFYCGHRFTFRTNYYRHQQTRLGRACKDCDKTFCKKLAFEQHMEMHQMIYRKTPDGTPH